MKTFLFVILACVVLCLVAGWSACSENSEQERAPLCKPWSQYYVGESDLNKSVSPCDLYFAAHETFSDHSNGEKWFRLMIRRGKPFDLDTYGKPTASQDQLQPYYYKWLVLDDKGKVVRSWLAYFIKNRDYSYHTTIRQPPEDWDNSVLEVYFEDVNGDGVREDVTYKLRVGEIVKVGNPTRPRDGHGR